MLPFRPPVDRGFIGRRLNMSVPETRNLRRWQVLALIALLAAACSNQPASPTTTTASTTSISDATTSVPSTSVPAGEATTQLW